MSMIQGPRAIAAGQAGGGSVGRAAGLRLSVAILSQINLAINEYANSARHLQDGQGTSIASACRSAASPTACRKPVRSRRPTASRRQLHRADDARASLATAAQVRVLASLASVYSATGMDLVPAGAELQDLPTLTGQVEAGDHPLAGWPVARVARSGAGS